MVDKALFNWTLQGLLAVLVVLMRVGPLVFFMPIFGSRGIPVRAKILVALAIALVLAPVVPVSAADLPGTPVGFLLFSLSEIAFAAILSLFARFVFAAVQLAGQHVTISMGMGMAAVIDPQFGSQTSLVGVFWNLIAILVFLGLDGHHHIIHTLVESFQWVRPGAFHLRQATYEGILLGAGHMFILSIKVMAPAAAVLLFSHVAMGVLARTVPQIPVMLVAMPLNIAIGFLFLGLSLTYLVPLLITSFNTLGSQLLRLAQGMGTV